MPDTMAKRLFENVFNASASQETKEVVIYNFDVKTQKIDLLHRGESFPKKYKEYQKLWRVKDKERNTETIIISV